MTPSGWKRPANRISDECGSILVTVLAMLAVLLTILLAAMTYAISRHSVHRANLNELHARYLAESGINRLAASAYHGHDMRDSSTFDTPNGGSCTVSREPWGPHHLITAEGRYSGQTATRRALLGSAGHEFLLAAVVGGDETLPVVVSGATLLRGTVVVGPSGLTEGRIQGEGVVYDDYHRGGLEIRRQIDLPTIDTSLLDEYLAALRTRQAVPDLRISGSQHWTDLSLFDDETDVIQIENNLLLDRVVWQESEQRKTLVVDGRLEFTGDCRISAFCEISAQAIAIGGRSVVDNVLLYAEDSMIVEDEATFSGLALSPGSITVRDKASLLYPAELLVFDDDLLDQRPAVISLTSTTPLEASLVGLGSARKEGDGAFIYVDTTSSVTGYIFCENDVDLRGQLFGTVMTERFRYDLPPTSYINWLKDCRVDRTRLTHAPLLPMLLDPDSTVVAGIIRED